MGFNSNIRIAAFIVLLLLPLSLMGQQERKYIRKGNRLYEKGNYAGSETQYHRAEGIDEPVPDASFNVGDALYKQGKYQEAAGNFSESADASKEPGKQAEALYNLGNSLLKDNKFSEAIEAYKKSLLISPDNMQAKYNLAYAQDQLKKQQDQQKQDQNKDQQKQDQNKDQQNKDQNKDQNKQDQNKDQQKQDQNKNDQNKDKQQNGQNKNDQGQDQQNQQGQNQDQNGPSDGNGQSQPSMSKQDAERLLDALSANEKDVQEKVNRNKMSQAKVRVVKNW